MKKSAKKVSKTATAAPVPTNSWMIQDKALKEMERGINLLHKQHYADALPHFESIVSNYPDEKELLDRVRVYVRVCRGMMDPKPGQSKKPDDLFYLGVIKANDASYGEAIDLFNLALQASPKDERVHYVLASTLALKGEREEALKHLSAAIELNALNRVHALNDPDFEPIRDDDSFQDLLHPEEA